MISTGLDLLSDWLAHRKGFLPFLGLSLILANLLFQFIFPSSWLTETNLCLHLGLILAIIGFLLSPVL